MVCKYGCVYVGGLLFIKRAYPCLSVVSADDDRQRRSVKVGPFPYLRKPLTAPDGDQADGLEVGRCRRTGPGIGAQAFWTGRTSGRRADKKISRRTLTGFPADFS